MTDQRIMCRECYRRLGDIIDGKNIVIKDGKKIYDVRGDVVITCECGHKFRKSAGYSLLVDAMKKWKSRKGTANERHNQTFGSAAVSDSVTAQDTGQSGAGDSVVPQNSEVQ